MVCSAVCDSGISWSNSLTFWHTLYMNFPNVLCVGLQSVSAAFPSNSLTFWYILNMNFLMVLWFGLKSVIVAFPGQTDLILVHIVN